MSGQISKLQMDAFRDWYRIHGDLSEFDTRHGFEAGVRWAEQRAERATLTLKLAGFSDHGDALWKPPQSLLQEDSTGNTLYQHALSVARRCLAAMYKGGTETPSAQIARRLHIVQRGIEAIDHAMPPSELGQEFVIIRQLAECGNFTEYTGRMVIDGPSLDSMPGVYIDMAHYIADSRNG